MGSPILDMRSVGKRFPGVVALQGVSLEIAPGEAHVLLGENGAGKSTLINLLAGVYRADEGEILFDGAPYRPLAPTDAFRAGIRVVHQELAMMPELSVAENLLFESLPQRRGLVDFRTLNRRAEALLAEVGLQVAPTLPVGRLGIAQMQLVEIAKALCYDSKLVILDEPTATLTSKEVDRLFEILRRLKARGVTTLYISHRLHEVYEIGQRVTVLRDGRLVTTQPLGNLTIPDIVRLMVGRELSAETVFAGDEGVGAVALRVAGLRRTPRSPPISFSLHKGEILGVAGLVGSGRTEAMRALFGADRKAAGDIFIDGEPVVIDTPKESVDLGLCLMTEDRKSQGLLLSMSCAENISITALDKISSRGLLQRGVERREAARLVKELSVKTPSVDAIVRTFSGGNQQKIVIAKWLFRGSKILICDEPTRGIDVGAKAEIHQLLWRLAAEGRAVLVVSSDLPELMAICHRILVFAKDRIVGEVARADFDQARILSLAYEELARERSP